MTGLLRTILAFTAGAVVLAVAPRSGVLATTQEIISLFSLLMAGLLPAMVVTATVLRGDSFSAVRLDAYGGALRLQLRFWAVLMIFAALATVGLIGAKIVGPTVSTETYSVVGFSIGAAKIQLAFICIAGGAGGVVIQRLWAAYQGLQSLLSLNHQMARAQALTNDRSRADVLQDQASRAKGPSYSAVE